VLENGPVSPGLPADASPATQSSWIANDFLTNSIPCQRGFRMVRQRKPLALPILQDGTDAKMVCFTNTTAVSLRRGRLVRRREK